ncbi:hypothetical protein BDF21DRAFT_448714 [Thamnidium elegans]|nr:hypothetical protein BDF21DRAFT_448714 [Thamnidium elegans]
MESSFKQSSKYSNLMLCKIIEMISDNLIACLSNSSFKSARNDDKNVNSNECGKHLFQLSKLILEHRGEQVPYFDDFIADNKWNLMQWLGYKQQIRHMTLYKMWQSRFAMALRDNKSAALRTCTFASATIVLGKHDLISELTQIDVLQMRKNI